MSSLEDYLDLLWDKVVNIDPEGKWISRGIATCRPVKKGAYSKCADALERLLKLAAAEDLGRVSRESRYAACFDILCSIEDPGLNQRMLPRVMTLMKEFLTSKVSVPKSLSEFWKSRMEVMLDPKDDGKWLLEMTKPNRCKGPFADVGPAVKRLRKAGATVVDLGCLTAWSRYEASIQALNLLNQSSLLEETSLEGLHEMFLISEPSGTEAGPKSWPLPPKVVSSNGRKAGNDPRLPLWKVRSGQAIAISPDSKSVAVAGASGPVRLLDAKSGKERLICEGLKAHIFKIAFSPDNRWVAAAQNDRWVTICNASTGKLAAKAKVSGHEVSGLMFSSKTGELIRSSWCDRVEMINPSTGVLTESLRPSADTFMIGCIALAPDEKRLVAVWTNKESDGLGHCTVWSWPDRSKIQDVSLPSKSIGDGAISRSGRYLALPFTGHRWRRDKKDGIYIIELSSGRITHTISAIEPLSVAFMPKDKFLIVSCKNEICRFYDFNTFRERFKLRWVGDVHEFAVSSNGKYLAAASSFSGAACWNLAALLRFPSA